MGVIKDIRARAAELLESGDVRAVLGYRRSTAGILAEPVFVTTASDAGELIMDATCVANLALYVVNEQKRQAHEREPDTRPLAIVAKGCDARALNVLLQENRIKREEVVILGASCGTGGVIDPRKLSGALGGKEARSADYDGAGNIVAAMVDSEVSVPAPDALADRCLECAQAYPVVSDSSMRSRIRARGSSESARARAELAVREPTSKTRQPRRWSARARAEPTRPAPIRVRHGGPLARLISAPPSAPAGNPPRRRPRSAAR